MGAGKTTVGKQLAKQLGKTFYDADHEIEKRTGVKVSVIFDLEGEVLSWLQAVVLYCQRLIERFYKIMDM